jgi:lysophospholipase L1-like esterase
MRAFSTRRQVEPGTELGRTSVPPGRQTSAAGQALIVMLVCMLGWTLLAAPTLRRSADASPDGARRTASRAALAPFEAISNLTRLTTVTDAAAEAVGHDPNLAPGGQVSLAPEPLPTGGGTPNPTDAPTADSTTPIRTPTGQDKLRVAVIGDSLAAGLGYGTERVFRPALVRVTRQGRISTGLARPDYFDWPGAMQAIVQSFQPDLVIVMLGENDNQGLRTTGGHDQTPIGTTAWPAAYEQRVEDFMRIAVSAGARVVWVGLPTVQDRSRWDFIRRENAIYEHAASVVPNVAYLDSWDLFAAADGGYTPFYRGSGSVQVVREPDGLHFTGLGYALLARAAAEMAERAFGLWPGAIQ